MQIRLIACLCALSLVTAACEKKEEQKAAEPAAKKTLPPKPKKTEPAVEKPQAVPGPEVAQCEEILDRGWQAIQPSLAWLKIDDPGSVEPRYKKSARNFLLRCQKLSKPLRDCLAKSENPYLDIAACKINDGKRVSERLYPPSLRSYIKLFEPRPLDQKPARKLLASLKGRWVNDWKAAKTRSTWKIDKQGKVSEKIKGRNNKVKEREFKISLVEAGRMRVEWNPSSTQPFVFFKPDRKTFYATGNLAYGFYPMTGKKSFVVQNGGDYIFYQNGKCQVVSNAGLIVEGECGYGKRKKEKIFKVAYQFPGRVMLNGKPRKDQRAYYPMGKHLLHESLVAAGKFRRR